MIHPRISCPKFRDGIWVWDRAHADRRVRIILGHYVFRVLPGYHEVNFMAPTIASIEMTTPYRDGKSAA